MSNFASLGPGEWANHHETVVNMASDQIELVLPDDLAGAYFCRSGAVFQALLGGAIAGQCDLRALGAGWTLSDLVASAGMHVSTEAQDAIFPVEKSMLAPDALVAANGLVLASGGVRISHLNTWLEKRGRSLRTSGASNGQSIAGAIATGTHGSVPREGGMQGHVAGIHLVTGPDSSVWLEHPDNPVLSDAAAQSFGAPTVTRDATLFEAARVHLGGLGIVNAVLLETDTKFKVQVVQLKKKIGITEITLLENGYFREFAASFQMDRTPYFVQVILNPFDPWGKDALLRFLFRDESPKEVADLTTSSILPDPVNLIAKILANHPEKRGQAISLLMSSLYNEIPDSKKLFQTWGETLVPHKRQGDLFSAAVAIDRGNLRTALDVMLPAFIEHGGGDLVFTLRFADKGPGTLAFNRFDSNVIIDLDGFHSAASIAAADRVFRKLEGQEIGCSYHWGKLGPLHAAKVASDFGNAKQQWLNARQRLLDNRLLPLFASTGLRNWGLT